jgi:apolipoprotein N-acyltransferase
MNLISITIFSFPFILLVKTKHKIKYWFFSFLLILFATNYLYGLNVLSKFKEKNIEKHDFVIKIVSPNIDLNEFLKNENDDVIIKKLIKLSNPKADQKTIFIWPEGMFSSIYLNEIKKYHKIFSKAFSNLHLIIFGINNLENKNNVENVYNSLAIVDNNLNLIGSYNKNKLVPFGEFLPMEKYLHKIGLKKITHGYKSFSRGEQRNVINIKNQYYDFKLLPLICYEIIYSGKINIKKRNVDLIVNISEDGWFGNSIGLHQHFNKAIYRAIEEGNYIARSANNGISAFIDPNGRILHKTEFNDANTIIASLPMHRSKTIFSKYGNKVFAIIIFLYIFLFFYFKKAEKNEEKKLSFYK